MRRQDAAGLFLLSATIALAVGLAGVRSPPPLPPVLPKPATIAPAAEQPSLRPPAPTPRRSKPLRPYNPPRERSRYPLPPLDLST